MAFTNQEALIEPVSENFPWVSLFVIIHTVTMTLGGSLRGLGKQLRATALVFFGLYIVGNPLSAVFCFYLEMGLKGIILGFTVGSATIMLLFYVTLTYFCDWAKLSK